MSTIVEPETVNSDPSNRNNKNKRRKHKKNKFLANAKGFGKRGIYGRGTNLVDDEFTYFVNILDAMKLGFESTDEKVAMANNVFDQTVDKEIHLSSNQVVSKCIEMLIGFTDEEHFEKFIKSFSDNFRPICSDRYASHVLQKMIEISFLRAVGHQSTIENLEPNEKKKKSDLLTDKEFNTTEKFKESHCNECSNFIIKIGKFLLNNLEDFVWDPFASHIMRTSILSLSGIHAAKVAFDQNKDITKHTETYVVPKEWTEIVQEFAKRLEMWPQFSDFPYTELSSTLMASICYSLRQIDKKFLKHFGKKILVEAFLKIDDDEDKKKIIIDDDDDNEKMEKEEINDKTEETSKENNIKVAKVFEAASSIRLLETLILVAGRKLFTQLYALLFPGKLKVLSMDRSTNFAVQKIIENVKEKIDFESMFNELSENIEEFLQIGHTGIVYALSNACLRLQTKQGAFVTALQNALHATGNKEKSDAIFSCLIKLKPYEFLKSESSSVFVHLHGSLIVQNILKFNKPIFLVNCLLAHPSNDLAAILSTPNGSYIADAFMESKFIGEKSREKLIRNLEGTYLDLAITKSGSRTIDKLFEFANDGQKSKIAKELSDQMNRLNGTMFGRLMCNKLRIETFKLSPTQWKAAFDRASKAEKLFKDIIA